MTPKVSIGIPAYKPEFLEEAIASVLAQTFEDWELIVVDDCSPGDIRGIVGKFSDPRTRYYRNEKNLGAEDPSYNWDKCVSYAQGEFFCLLCDDDMYHPKFLEEMLKLAELFPDCNVFRARGQFIDRNGNVTSKYPSSPLWESCEDYIWHNSKGLRHQTVSEWMLRRQHIQGCGGYAHLPLAWTADVISMYQFSVEGGIASSYKILVTFRNSGLNISSYSDANVLPKLDAYILEREQTVTLIKANGMSANLLALVANSQEKQIRWLLSHTSIPVFLRIVLFKRNKYRLSRRAVFVDIAKRLLKVLTNRSSCRKVLCIDSTY